MVVYGSVDRAYMGNMGLISTVITMVSHIVVLLLYWFIFRRDLQGFFNARRFGEFVLLGWSVLAIGAFNLISEILEHESYGNPGVALLMGMQPGICEEIMLRVIPISLVMRSKERERLVIPVVVFTSLLFGLWHGFNILSGANPRHHIVPSHLCDGCRLPVRCYLPENRRYLDHHVPACNHRHHLFPWCGSAEWRRHSVAKHQFF